MTKIIFATGNKGKLKEINEILAGTDYEVVSMKDAGFDIDVEETGETFEENALIKARAICEASGCLTLSDDSGMEIDYLNKAPGVQSARFLGHDTSYDIKNAKILEMLEGVPKEKRTARYVCSIAAVWPDGRSRVVTENFEGYIAFEAKGTNGFGYDPIFFVPEYNMTDAELAPEIKNEIGHRGKAMRRMKEILEAMA
ncbi:MAG: RdgB/HAM1 family non-canonical purine NTP pyrophosphatase [Lachnospiraceae bacterium]|nr:RdgB/HAM1 family non-canonical purine NTP pyrophosphatase [Lachnospiraceae bacterium]